MCPTTPSPPDDEEALMGLYLSEAGDPRVEARPEHVTELRTRILERLEPRRSAWRSRGRLLVGSGLAALVVIAAVSMLSRPGIAWAQVASALQKRPWIHGTVAGPDGKTIFEQWLSLNREVGAERGGPEVAFHDYKRKVMTKYVPGENVVYRLPEPPPANAGDTNFLRQLLDQLLNPDGPGKFPFEGMDLIGQTRREVKEGDKTWLEIELTFRVAGGSRGGPVSMRIRVDPATNLPMSLDMEDEDQKRYTTAIDYPDRGPADIYDLGAPRGAKVVDRTPLDNVGPVIAGLKAGRKQFDDYCAFVVQQRLLPTNHFPRVTVYRVWRKGNRWRIDELRPDDRGWAPSDDVDLAWWKAHEPELTFVPSVICEGKVYWFYSLTDAWKPGMLAPKPGEPNAMGQTVGPNALLGAAEDPIIPFWCQDVLPEQTGHPSGGVGEPDHDREFLVDAKPSDGPPGTILFHARDTKPKVEGMPDPFRLWVDPKAGYLSMRTEIRVHEPKNLSKVAFIDTHVVEDVAKSPKGSVYPTRTRHVAYNGEHVFVRRFFVDFQAKISDDLFKPLK